MTALEIRLEQLERRVAEQQAAINELQGLSPLERLEPMTQVEIRELALEIHQQGLAKQRRRA